MPAESLLIRLSIFKATSRDGFEGEKVDFDVQLVSARVSSSIRRKPDGQLQGPLREITMTRSRIWQES